MLFGHRVDCASSKIGGRREETGQTYIPGTVYGVGARSTLVPLDQHSEQEDTRTANQH